LEFGVWSLEFGVMNYELWIMNYEFGGFEFNIISMKLMIVILFLTCLFSCIKDEYQIPELTDLNPRVCKIKIPSPSGYWVLKINFRKV
jgi:hypothetical protein